MRVISGSSAPKPSNTFCERRDHEDVDDDDRHRHRDDHEHRVAQRGLHLLAHQLLELEVVEQAQEDLVEPAGQLADAHHRDVEAGEHAVLARHRRRQLDAALEALAHLADDVAAAPVARPIPAGPASARMIGTPALSSVCSWRLNSSRSLVRDLAACRSRRSSSAAAAARRAPAARGSIAHRRDAAR